MAMPVAIQSIEPTRLDIHHNVNKVILLKVVNPDTSPMVGDGEKTSIRHDSPIQSFGGFSHVKSSDRESKYPQIAQGTRHRFSSKKKMSMDNKLKYFNILNNVNNLNGSCSSHARFTSCQSPGFSMVKRKTDSEPILKAAAPQQPGFTLHHNAPETSNIPTQAPRFRNSLKESLKTKPTYSPIFLKELQQKYDMRHREVERKVPTQSPGFRNSQEESLKMKPVYSPNFLKELQQKYDRKRIEMETSLANHDTVTLSF